MNRRDALLNMYANDGDDAQRQQQQHNSNWLAWISAAFLLQTKHSTIMPCLELRRNECSICQHAIIERQRLEAICGHTFHRHCLVMWMRTYAFCPDCPRRM